MTPNPTLDSVASENQPLGNSLVIEYCQSVFQGYNTRTLGRLNLNKATLGLLPSNEPVHRYL